MLIDSYNGKSYIDETQITSMTIIGDFQWNNGRSSEDKPEKVYNIHANASMQGVEVLCFKTKEEANEALLKIHTEVERIKSQEVVEQGDYIQGFKDGTEYALKLEKK